MRDGESMQILYFPIPSTTKMQILGEVEVGVLRGYVSMVLLASVFSLLAAES